METHTTFRMTTDQSSMFTELVWESDGKHATGDLYVTFTNGSVYRYEYVLFRELQRILNASDENRSMGAVLNDLLADHDDRVVRVA